MPEAVIVAAIRARGRAPVNRARPSDNPKALGAPAGRERAGISTSIRSGSFGCEPLSRGGIRPLANGLRASRRLVQDGAVAARDLGLIEGGVGGEQRFVMRLRARVEERDTDADGGVNRAGTGGM
jgi:hypothetical protein